MYKIGLTALALLFASPALADREVFTIKQLTPQVKTYLSRGWNDNTQQCFWMGFGDIAEDTDGDWKIVADDSKGTLGAYSKEKDAFFRCDETGLTEKTYGSKVKHTPMNQLPL